MKHSNKQQLQVRDEQSDDIAFRDRPVTAVPQARLVSFVVHPDHQLDSYNFRQPRTRRLATVWSPGNTTDRPIFSRPRRAWTQGVRRAAHRTELMIAFKDLPDRMDSREPINVEIVA